MISAHTVRFISEEEYLAGEELAEEKHEYCDGRVYAMAGATNGHELVSGNFFAALHSHLRGKGCRVYKSDMKVRVLFRDAVLFYYPDVLVACDPTDPKDTHLDKPKLIIEVLSVDWKRDLAEKALMYRHIPSLEEYVVVDPRRDVPEVFIHRRADGWEPPEIVQGMTAEITLRSVALTLKVADLFAV